MCVQAAGEVTELDMQLLVKVTELLALRVCVYLPYLQNLLLQPVCAVCASIVRNAYLLCTNQGN